MHDGQLVQVTRVADVGLVEDVVAAAGDDRAEGVAVFHGRQVVAVVVAVFVERVHGVAGRQAGLHGERGTDLAVDVRVSHLDIQRGLLTALDVLAGGRRRLAWGRFSTLAVEQAVRNGPRVIGDLRAAGAVGVGAEAEHVAQSGTEQYSYDQQERAGDGNGGQRAPADAAGLLLDGIGAGDRQVIAGLVVHVGHVSHFPLVGWFSKAMPVNRVFNNKNTNK